MATYWRRSELCTIEQAATALRAAANTMRPWKVPRNSRGLRHRETPAQFERFL